jgi:hypothetical protein
MKSLKDLERKFAYSVLARDDAAGPGRDAGYAVLGDLDRVPGRRAPAFHAVPEQGVPEQAVPDRSRRDGTDVSEGDGGAGADWPGGDPWLAGDRTSMLVNRGRGSAYHPAFFRRRPVLYVTAATVMALVISLIIVLLTGGASWPSSVGTMQGEITTACQNPDVLSEPGQINFACANGTQQILWVFALLASSGNPQFADSKSGRIGLEPIAPAQGAEVAWSLNLHHPYNPLNPIDSLEVAARAINNIIGGASAIGANGSPSVQPGLESDPSNCLRYTGFTAVSTRAGFPTVCSHPITTTAQQAALVADVYTKWAGSAQAAQDAALLFENAGNPGDPRVQAILKNLAQTNL